MTKTIPKADEAFARYVISDPKFQSRRTLAEYGYPGLRSALDGDKNQVVVRHTRNAPFPRVLMVDQLRAHVVDDRTLVTFFQPKDPEKGARGFSQSFDVLSTVNQDLMGDSAERCVDVFDCAARVVSSAVTGLLGNKSIRELQILPLYEENIAVLTSLQAQSLGNIRQRQRRDLEQNTRSTNLFDTRKDLAATLELHDIQDEPLSIKKLMNEQWTILQQMIDKYKYVINSNKNMGKNGISTLENTVKLHVQKMDRIGHMLHNVQATLAAFEEMNQKQATMMNEMIAGEQAEVNAEQSRAILVFTVFTIIFLPLLSSPRSSVSILVSGVAQMGICHLVRFSPT